jgi:CHAD domain-containing protein
MCGWRGSEAMSYQLRRNQALDANLRRICRKQVESALEIVRGEREANDTPVHETRKHLKKARAALQIASGELGRTCVKEQDHRFRDVARLISDVRDAEVRLQTVRQLQEITRRTSQKTFHNTEELLVAELEHFIAAFAGWQKQAAPELEKLRKEIDAWPIGNLDGKMIRRAVQRAYKSARDALTSAKAKPIPENFHEFRSEAKRLLYQLRILRPINPVVIGALIDDLDSVGEVFGRSHDLYFLGERLRREDGQTPGQETPELVAVIEASEVELQDRGVDLAERFFEERPRAFGHRVAIWLQHWLEGGAPTVADALVCHDASVLK